MGRNLRPILLSILCCCYASVCGVRGRATHQATHRERQEWEGTSRSLFPPRSRSAKAPSLALWSAAACDGERFAPRAEGCRSQGRAMAKGRCAHWRAPERRVGSIGGSRPVARSATSRHGYQILRRPNHPRRADIGRLVCMRARRRGLRSKRRTRRRSPDVRGLRGAARRVVSRRSPCVWGVLGAGGGTPQASTSAGRGGVRVDTGSGCARPLRRGLSSAPRRRRSVADSGLLGLVYARSSGICYPNTRRRLAFITSRTTRTVDSVLLGSLRSVWDRPMQTGRPIKPTGCASFCQEATQPVTSSRPRRVDGPQGGQSDGTK